MSGSLPMVWVPYRHRLFARLLGALLALPATEALADSGWARETAGERYTLNFHQADLTSVTELVAAVTGKSFLFDSQVREKLSIFSPVPVTADETWLLFQAALDAGGTYTLVPLRERPDTYQIVPRREAARMATPVVVGTSVDSADQGK